MARKRKRDTVGVSREEAEKESEKVERKKYTNIIHMSRAEATFIGIRSFIGDFLLLCRYCLGTICTRI